MAAGRSSDVPTLPGPLDEAAPPAALDTAHAAAQGCLVLVVEDDKTHRMVLERQFALLGMAAAFAHDGTEAGRQRRARGEAYGLLLTDLHRPGMDGFEVTAAIRKDEAGAHRMPIVALTASAVRAEIKQCKSAGMDDALGKPIQLSELGAAVRHWVARGRVRAPVARPPAAFDASVLLRAVGHAQWAEAGAVAQRWKSASRAVGATPLAQRLHALEQACRDGGAAANEIAAALQADLAAVERWLHEPTLA